MKSIAVPVTRKSVVSAKKKKPRPAGHPAVAPSDSLLMVTPPTRGARGTPPPPRPVAAEPRPVTLHRYHVGQRLRMQSGGRNWARPETICRVLALLPVEGGPLRYRVRSEAESYERIVDEIDLTIPA